MEAHNRTPAVTVAAPSALGQVLVAPRGGYGMSVTEKCAACERVLTVPQAVRLWDARWYCRQCLDAACPGLADYSARHESLEDIEPPPRVLKILTFYFGWWLTLAVILPAPFAVLTLVVSGLDVALQIFTPIYYYWGAILLLPILLCVFIALAQRADVIVVSVHNNMLRLRHRNSHEWFEVPLHSCQWHVGPVRDPGKRPWCRIRLAPEQAVVLLRIPTGNRAFGRYGTLVCGASPTTRRIWEAFLTLAEVPKLRPCWLVRALSKLRRRGAAERTEP